MQGSEQLDQALPWNVSGMVKARWIPGEIALLRLCSRRTLARIWATSWVTIVDRGGVRRGTLEANFASGRRLVVSKLIDSGVH